MNSIQKFVHSQFGVIRTLKTDDGQIWFVGKDVATALGYANPTKAVISHVLGDDKLHSQIGNAGQMRDMLLVNESGLYALIFASKLPQALAFKHWVTAEVLPQIRKTGGYIPTKDAEGHQMTELEIMSQAFLIMQKTIDQQKNQIAAQEQKLIDQQPKVDFAKAVEDVKESILISEMAKLLTRNGYEIGRTRFFDWLREKGYLFKDGTEPIQKWVEKGIFSTHVHTYTDNHGGVHESITTKITGKGQEYFFQLFASRNTVNS